MSKIGHWATVVLAAGGTAGCASLPVVNTAREVEVREIVAAVECEIVAAVRALGPKEFKLGKWDVKSSLELSLVESVGADGKIAWIIPVANTLTPSLSGSYKRTSTAHVDFITLIRDAMKGPAGACWSEAGVLTDPSGTGLGLAAWMQTTFLALGEKQHGGLSYTRDFELTGNIGARFGFAFSTAPVSGEVGALGGAIRTHHLVVTVSPHVDAAPSEVILVEDRSHGRAKVRTRREQVLTNPIGNFNLLRQTPVRLAPGTTVTPRLAP